MAAEEYIKDNTFQTEEDSWDVVEVEYVYEAIEMARKEEREKAMDAFDKVLSNMTYHISRGEDYGNIYQKFKELLNK